MSEVFNIDKGKYNNHNVYWQSFSIINEISKLTKKEKDGYKVKIDKIYKEYEILSAKYQLNKHKNKIPLN